MPISAFPQAVQHGYEIHEWRHASAILKRDLRTEWDDVGDVRSRFRLRESFITTPGRGQSAVSKGLQHGSL